MGKKSKKIVNKKKVYKVKNKTKHKTVYKSQPRAEAPVKKRISWVRKVLTFIGIIAGANG